MYSKTNTLLKLENISLKFGEKLVLRDINLDIKDIVATDTLRGQISTILGRSGVGKTQLFKIIAGLLKPTTGSVLTGEKQLPVEPGMVGMVLQSYPLFQHRTLLSNLQMVCSDKSKINDYLVEFDLMDHSSKYPAQLSGGQRQRTAIVQQLLCSEHFILLDEPFSGLDPVAIDKLCKNIIKVANRDESNTVIISSHILEPALAISDSVYMLGYENDRQEFVSAEQKTITHKKPGATLKYYYDLAAAGLAWNPEIRKDPRFIELVEDIRKIFQTL